MTQNPTSPGEGGLTAEALSIVIDFIDWVDRFTGRVSEAQSGAMFDLYRRARSVYRQADPVAHDASRAAAIARATNTPEAEGGAG